MKTTIICLLLAVYAPSALAENWEKFSETDKRSDFIDSSSLVRKGTHVRSWSKVSFVEPQVYKGNLANGANFSSALQYADINCEAREMYMVKVVYYAGMDADGGVVVTENPTPGERAAFDPVTPGSVGDIWMRRACVQVKRKK